MNYRPTIGLEIHAELKTRTKMFCGCRNDPDETRPNVNICPVCMAHPGTLPVINKEAVRKILLVGAAVGGSLADRTVFDRKNYFYPDIPKGYQISQYKHPLVSGGALSGVALTRIHLEEDTARSQHAGDKSLVDFNRAGVPLMELVTEPVIHSAEEAGRFARELQLLLRALGAGEANMEKGEMRVEANVSVASEIAEKRRTDAENRRNEGLRDSASSLRPSAISTLGTKVEIKNLNSFRAAERAIRHEVERHIALLDRGEKVIQETRGWDEGKQATFSQRKKEVAQDYRYFPEPDLPELRISELPELSEEKLRADLPELPWQKRERLNALGFLQAQDVEQLLEDEVLSRLFSEIEQILAEPESLKIAANFLLNDIAGQRKKEPVWLVPDAAFLAEVVRWYQKGTISSRQAKDSILTGKMRVAIDEGELPALVKKIIDANPEVVADYRAGKAVALEFLVGRGMKESKGAANPTKLREAIEKILGR